MDLDLVNDRVRAAQDEEGGDLGDILRGDHLLAGQIRAGDLCHIGKDAARGDQMHADALFIDLRGQRLCKPGHGVLGRGIGGLAHIALVGGDGGDIEDGRRLRLPQQRQRLLAQEKQ